MAKKLRSEDIIEKGLFKDEIENTEKFLKIVKGLKDEFKELAKASKSAVDNKASFGNSEDVNKFKKAVDDLNKSTEQLTNLEKQELKLKQKLSDLDSERAKEVAKLRVETQEKNKQLKEEAKISLNLLTTYQKQSKRLNELRNKYKNLVLEQGRNAEGAKELRQEIEELDKTLKNVDAEVGQFQRSVGNYEKINKGAQNSFGSLSGFLLGAFSASFMKSRDSARSFNITIEKLKNNVNILFIAVKEWAESQWWLEGLFSIVENAISKMSKTTEESNKILEDRLKMIDRNIDIVSRLEVEIAKLTSEEEKLQAIADDNTRSFAERNKAIKGVTDSVAKEILKKRELTAEEKGLLRIQKERAEKQLEIAKGDLEIAKLAIKNDFARRGSLEKYNQLLKEGNIENLAFLKDKDIADKLNIENIENLKNAVINLNEAEKEKAISAIEAQKTLSELKQDELERDLDILIDGFDNQKTINERKIQDERYTVEQRKALFDETRRLADESFTAQKKVLEDLSKAGVNIDELLGLDATELQKRIRELEQSEIIEGRTLEVVRERKTVLQDLEDLQKDLTEATKEQALAEAELQAIQQGQRGENLANAVIEKRIELLEEEIKKRKELNQATTQLELEKAKLEIDLEKQKAEKRKELIQETADFIAETINRETELKINAIETELDASKRREDQLIEAANQGNRLADESIAVERERQAKLEAERKKQLQRQKTTEIALAAITAYTSNSKNGEGNALAKTIADISTLLSFAQNVQAFEEGGLVEGGEQLVRINEKGQEFVLKHDTVKKIGVDKLNRLNQGDINALNDSKSFDVRLQEVMINKAMQKVSQEFKEAVKGIAVEKWELSEITQGLKKVYQKGNSLKAKHYRKGKTLN